MLSNTLNTNEIKNATGTEVEFSRISQGDRQTEFSQITETPNAPHRLTVKHSESGSGVNRRRRSVIRFDKAVASTVDTTKMVTVSCYAVADLPVGALTANTELANVVAELMSFLASTGADSTIKFDCTGNGAATLLNGQL